MVFEIKLWIQLVQTLVRRCASVVHWRTFEIHTSKNITFKLSMPTVLHVNIEFSGMELVMWRGNLGHTNGSAYDYSSPSVWCRNFKYSEACLQRNRKGPDFFRPVAGTCRLIRVFDVKLKILWTRKVFHLRQDSVLCRFRLILV
jgi:hypothetical protein